MRIAVGSSGRLVGFVRVSSVRFHTSITPKHLVVGAVLAVAATALIGSFDAVAWWVDLTRPYMAFGVDEWPLAFPFLLIWLAWVYRDQSRENARLVAERDREIAERRQTEAQARKLAEQLETALDHRSLFFTAMSHDLRTPLNAVLAYSELLEHGGTLGARETDKVRRIGAGGRLLLMLVDEILDVAALDAGEQVRLNEDVFDLEEELSSIAGFCGFVNGRPIPSVALGPDCRGLVAATDRRRLRQCLSNLLFNAFKHSGTDSAVWIEVRRLDDASVRITVADNGCGIPEAVMARIGDPFISSGVPYKAESSSGFGLYMVGRYMELLGGDFVIESHNGRGTRAQLMLPASAVDRTETEPDMPEAVDKRRAASG